MTATATAPREVAEHLDARYVQLVEAADRHAAEAARLLSSMTYATDLGLLRAADSLRADADAELTAARVELAEAARIHAARIAR